MIRTDDLRAWSEAIAGIRIRGPIEIFLLAEAAGYVPHKVIRIVATMIVPHVETGESISVLRGEPVPTPRPDGIDVAAWVREALLQPLVLHELDEWISVEGARRFDPHAFGRIDLGKLGSL